MNSQPGAYKATKYRLLQCLDASILFIHSTRTGCFFLITSLIVTSLDLESPHFYIFLVRGIGISYHSHLQSSAVNAPPFGSTWRACTYGLITYTLFKCYNCICRSVKTKMLNDKIVLLMSPVYYSLIF